MQFSDFPYGIISGLRNLFYDRGWLSKYKASLPVICVGNLSSGGNGKTPLVFFLSALLREHNKRPVILSRGYGGTIVGPHLVNKDDSAYNVGDEPLMLHNCAQCPVVVARKRVAGAQLIEEMDLGDVIILDDGFQHRALDRNLDIICVYAGSEDAIKSFKEGVLLPLGRFRESKVGGLKRAQVIMFNSRSLTPVSEQSILELTSGLPKHLAVFKSYLVIDEISSLEGVGLEMGQPAVVDVVCGLAQPEAFFSSLESFGLTIYKKHVYRDHVNYSRQDLLNIITQSQGRPLVCSEKDYVKLEAFNIKSLFVAKTSLIVEPQEKFIKLIMEKSSVSNSAAEVFNSRKLSLTQAS